VSIHSKVQEIIKQAVPAPQPAEVARWDSMTRVRVMIELERAFGVRFSGPDVANIKSLNDVIALIESKMHN
jgi:acyl carrier protein